MENKIDLREVLPYIPVQELDYQTWISVGMALHDEGYDCSVWDEWSRNDSRYHSGECSRKWQGFHGSATPVTGGTVVQLAKDYGWHRSSSEQAAGYALDWDSIIGGGEKPLIDSGWLEGIEIQEPADWNPVKDLITYLEILFDSTDNVGYVTECWEKEGEYFPSKGVWSRTAGELIQQLNRCNGDICTVIGDYNPQVGAWIRFNPLDGKGVKNENVTDFRYALVESDTMELDKQYAMIKNMELPVACLVYSGGKSVHAIVRIEAENYTEYRKRVEYLYGMLKKNGMQIDTQNKNPSRLSRMPGVTRKGKKQFLIGTNLGKGSWQEWVESTTDELSDPEHLEDVWNITCQSLRRP